jgi:hypothetical protein
MLPGLPAGPPGQLQQLAQCWLLEQLPLLLWRPQGGRLLQHIGKEEYFESFNRKAAL